MTPRCAYNDRQVNRVRFSLEQRVAGAFGIGLAILACVSLFSFRGTGQLIATGDLSRHAQEVLIRLESLLSTMTDVETGSHRFVITGDERFLEPYNAAAARIANDTGRLRAFASDPAFRVCRWEDPSRTATKRSRGIDGIR